MSDKRKDIYNGNIRPQCRGLVDYTIVLATAIFIILGLVFILVARFYVKVEYAGRIALYVIGALCLLCGLAYASLSILFIRMYPKHKKIAYMLLQEYVFNDKDMRF